MAALTPTLESRPRSRIKSLGMKPNATHRASRSKTGSGPRGRRLLRRRHGGPHPSGRLRGLMCELRAPAGLGSRRRFPARSRGLASPAGEMPAGITDGALKNVETKATARTAPARRPPGVGAGQALAGRRQRRRSESAHAPPDRRAPPARRARSGAAARRRRPHAFSRRDPDGGPALRPVTSRARPPHARRRFRAAAVCAGGRKCGGSRAGSRRTPTEGTGPGPRRRPASLLRLGPTRDSRGHGAHRVPLSFHS